MEKFSISLTIDSLLVLIGTISLNVVNGQQEENDNFSFNRTQITDSIYMLSGGGGNVGVSVGDDGIFLIDDKLKV